MHRILIALLAVSFVPAPLPAQHFPSDAVLLDLLRAQVERNGAGGIVLGMVDTDGSTRVLTFGDAGPEALPLGPETIFEIGSITKVFTGTLLAEAVGRGEISLTEPIETYLPEGLHVPTRGGRHITALDLATHRSGIQDNRLRVVSVPGTPFQVERLYAALMDYELTRDIGSVSQYSNFGIDLLADILDRVTDGDYESTVRDRILTPLGMRNTGYTPTTATLEHAAQTFDSTGHVIPTPVFGEGQGRSVRGGVGLTSNIEEMLVFLKAYIDPPDSQLGEAMRMAQQTQTNGGKMGLTWDRRTAPGGQQIVSKTGGVRGFVSYIGFDPHARVGVVLLANVQGGLKGLRNLGHHLVNPGIPLRAGGESIE
jgi:D-alanyl-D-alanine-carboxypeptidase/D-alanyl-D-alanine-endopeptidase